MSRVYDEIIDLIARSTGPRDITSFQPSKETNDRVYALIHKEKESSLSAAEKQELDDYLRLEHLMRMVKARARLHLANE